MHANIREWADLTGTDFLNMDRARTVVMVSCSPLEVHGPHLPMQTDYCEAEALSLRAAEMLCDRLHDISFVRLPPIYVAADVVPQPGSVMFRTGTIIRVLSDLGRSLAKQGFKHIWVGSFHGGPRHFVSIETACDRVSRRHDVTMISVFSLLVNKLTGGESDLAGILGHIDGLSPEQLKGDAHAGAVETSMMLYLRGQHVASNYAGLSPMTVAKKLLEKGIAPESSEGKPSFMELIKSFPHKMKYYEYESYAGDPAIGTAEIGGEILETLAGYTADELAEVWKGNLSHKQCHSPLWPARWVFTNETITWAFERAMRYKTQVF